MSASTHNHDAQQTPLRLAQIGLGAAGRSHLAVITGMPEIELVGVADLSEQTVRQVSEKHHITGTTDHHELLADESIEAISVVAADIAHYPLVMDCAAAGKHVICEKPIATEIAHAREMVQAMRQAGKLLCITFNNRAGAVTRRIKELVDAGAVGNVRMVRLVGLMAAPDNRLLRERMGEKGALARARNICVEGKNALYDCGVHSFDFARYLTGSDFRRIEAMGCSMRGFPYPDHGVALCEHENGIFTLIEKGFDYAYEAQTYKEYTRYEVIGDRGSLAWDLDTQHLKLFSVDQTLDEPLAHGGKEDVREILYRGFVESVRAGALLPWLSSGLDGLKATEAAQAATDCMQARGVVKRDVGDAPNWFDHLDRSW